MKNDDEIMLAGSDSAGRSSRSEDSESGVSQSLSNQMLDEMIRNSKNATNSGGSDKAGTINNEMRKNATDSSDSKSNGSSDAGSTLQKLKDGSAGSEAQGHRDSAGEGRESVEKGAIDRLRKNEWHFKTGKDGVETLPTGDKFVQDGDREILFMPNGDKLSVNKDGSFDLKSNGGVEVKKQGDQTTVKFANGDEVTFSKKGITSVTRDGRTVDLISAKDIINSIKERNELHPHVKPGGGAIEKESIPNKLDKYYRPGKGGEDESKPIHNLNRPGTGAPLDQPKKLEK